MKPSWVVGVLCCLSFLIGLSCKGCGGNGGGGGNPTVSGPTVAPVLFAAVISSSEIDLSWTINSSVQDGFLIERDSGSGFIQIAVVAGSSSVAFKNLGLLPSSSPPNPATSYSYRIRAYNSGGDGPYSNTVMASTKPLKWTKLAPTGGPPAARGFSTIIYDVVNGALVLFGGDILGGSLNDSWSIALSSLPLAWASIATAPPPPLSARGGHASLYDPANQRMIVYGGDSLDPAVWALSLPTPLTGAAWSSPTPGGTIPGARDQPSAVYDAANQRMIVFGGQTLAGPVNEVWSLSLPTTGPPVWSQLFPTGTAPTPRSGHSAIYDPINQRMIVFGGTLASNNTNETWELTLPVGGTPAWSPLGTAGSSPTARTSHSAVYDTTGMRMIVFGGDDGLPSNNILNETWVLTLSGTPTWLQLTLTGPPPARSAHAALFDTAHSQTLIFGGLDATPTPSGPIPLNDLWSLGD
jgi:hypothetical protein